MSRRLLAVATLVAGALALGACAGDREKDSTADGVVRDPRGTGSPDGSESFSDGAGPAARVSGDSDAVGAYATGASAGSSPKVDRSIIRRATLEVAAKDVVRATREATRIAEASGGSVSSSRSDLEGRESSELVLRVPPENYRDALEQLRDIGDVRELTESSDDVTDQAVDLEGRLAATKASTDRLRGLLSEAKNVVEIASVESELTKRESELESLSGRLRVLESQVDQASITVRVVERSTPAIRNDDGPGFVGGLRNGWDAAVGAANVLLVIAGFSLPFVPVLVLALLGVRLLRRRRRSNPAVQ